MINIIGLDGKRYKMDVNPLKYPLRERATCKSGIQYECGQLLKAAYPYLVILEEVYVTDHNFYLDFFLPFTRQVFEIHGEQHDKYVPYFHKSIKNYNMSKARDARKKEFCEANSFEFTEIRSVQEMKEYLSGKRSV